MSGRSLRQSELTMKAADSSASRGDGGYRGRRSAIPAEQAETRVIARDSARPGGDLFSPDGEACRGERSHDRGQPLPGARFGGRGAVPRGVRAVTGVESAADQQPLGVDLQVVAQARGDLGEAALVRLVRCFVPGEP